MSYQEFQPNLDYINSSIQIQILVVAKDVRYVTEVDKNTATIHDINQFVGEQLSLQSTSKITAISRKCTITRKTYRLLFQ